MTDARTADRSRRRAPRHVKAAARILHKEGRRILRKHGDRIAAPVAIEIRNCLAAMEDHRRRDAIEALEIEAERLDELLHQHASFARKSALRETIENVAIAILVALALRSCLYEPFKIPSGSMMPTLRAGDHIFVNKYVYGVQVPFTNHVIGERWGDIERGDVVVFRYPLDESEDFIKRVIGLAGDEIKVEGREVAIKRAGRDDFEVLEHRKLDQRCYDETGTRVVTRCQLYEESIDGRTYVVRYRSIDDTVSNRSRTWKVPDNHLLVMGDNRNESHDSLAWTVTVEAVAARGLLSVKDLRDLTEERLFTLTTPRAGEVSDDPHYDHVVYVADHRSPEHDLELSVWRKPLLGTAAVVDTLLAGAPNVREATLEGLLDGDDRPRGARRDRILEIGSDIDRLVVAEDDDEYAATAILNGPQAVLHLRCGKFVCAVPSQLADRMAEVTEVFQRDHDQDARDLIRGDRAIRYNTHWTVRDEPDDRFLHRRFVRAGGSGPKDELVVRAWRDAYEGLGFLRDAALRSLGSAPGQAEAVPDLGEDVWLVDGGDAFSLVLADRKSGVVAQVRCGKSRCARRADLLALARDLSSRMPAAARDRRSFGELMGQRDAGNWPEVPVRGPDTYEFDRVSLEGTVRGGQHALDLEVWLRPDEGVDGKLAAIRREMPGLGGDDSIAAGGLAGTNESGDAVVVFPVEDSESVVRLLCRRGLCPDVEIARALARRAAEKAKDSSNFIDPEAERPRPFVPRGNVKGRAERIWLPIDRFWLPVR